MGLTLVPKLLNHQRQRQHARKFTTKPRGQLSGAVARTKKGKEINTLRRTLILVSSNNTSGQRGPWFIK